MGCKSTDPKVLSSHPWDIFQIRNQWKNIWYPSQTDQGSITTTREYLHSGRLSRLGAVQHKPASRFKDKNLHELCILHEFHPRFSEHWFIEDQGNQEENQIIERYYCQPVNPYQ